MTRTAVSVLLGAAITFGPALIADQTAATSVQYKSPAGVGYRSLPDTEGVTNARAALVADPRNVSRIIDLGVAQSGARQFREAIATFTRGLEIEPNNALLLRWRGHRYLSVRDFDRAYADLTRGGRIDSSIYGIWYHLGIVQYVRGEFAAAAASFTRAQPIAPDPGELAGSTDWLWMSLNRAGRGADAKAMLDLKPEARLAPIDNAYTRRLKLYRGEIGPDAVITPADTDDVQIATLAFGLGNWHLIKGDKARARAAFERSVQASGGWPGFGFILSEVELRRLALGFKQVNPTTGHWPRFRGPNSNPVAENPNLPVSWSKTENVEWVTDVAGVGWSSPVVWGNRIFITAATSDKPMKQPSTGVDFSNEYLAELRKQGLSAADANKKLYERDREMPDEIVISLMLFCYDLETGKQLWEREMYKGRPAGGRHSKNSFASETPTTDGERVYVYLTDYGLFAYDFEGKQAWTTPLKSHATTRDWGTGASASLHKDRLFVLNDNEEQSFVAAFDTRTGKELWRTPRTVQPARKTGWSTPFVWENRARTELVTLGPGVAISYSLDGAELWRMNRMGGYAIQSPFAWNDFLFVTSGAGGEDHRPIVAIRAGGSGNITPPASENRNEHVAWYDQAAGGTYLPTPVIYKNALYVLNDKGIFSRRNPETGERTYQSRVAPGAAAFTASPWAYNGYVFVMSEEGDTFVIDAGNEYRLVGTNALDDFSMATPAIVGDRLLIRTQHRLYSIRNRR